ncbi:MAG: hypothetical protein JNM31_03450 [Flavobacteriales bacterium]|nr:hypothetical protein [Flavobacteriales bacterium]
MRTPGPLAALGVLVVTGLLAACTAHKPTVQVAPARDVRWAPIDSLDSLGLYRSALSATDSLLAAAQREGDWRTEFRAWMYRSRLRQVLDEEAWPEVLNELEMRTITAGFPLKQLLHSVTAEFLSVQYRHALWDIAGRDEVEMEADDPLTWGVKPFVERILAHHAAALEPYDSLRQTPVAELGPLLAGDPRALHLRPSLFDLLAHRALRVYHEPLMRLAGPLDRFELNDARHFALFEDFAYRRLEHPDSGSWPFQALRLHQRLERAHLSDDAPDALVSATLERLTYVHANSTLPQKDSLLLRALETLRTRLPEDSCWSEVTWNLAEWHGRTGDRHDRLGSGLWKDEKRTTLALCDSAISRFPGSFGARNAEALRERLLKPDLKLHAEGTVTPDKPFKVAVTYRNTPKQWLRLVADPDRGVWRSRLDTLVRRTPLRSWSVELPDDGDLNEHLVELGIEALPIGRYTLVVSSGPDFVKDMDAMVSATFHVSRLAVADRHENGIMELLVLDRESGWHRPGVQVECFGQRWENGAQKSVLLTTDTTDRDGRIRFALPEGLNQAFFTITDGADRLTTPSRHAYRYRTAQNDSIRSFLFTDRAIYRPGQEVFVKGIVTVKRDGRTVVKERYRSTVKFQDVHGRSIDSASVVTDDFGAYTVRFTAPRGALTGGMTIRDAHGTRWLRVEEYKRPTFEVVLDTLHGQHRLGDEVVISGTARSYAGVPLDGAQVKYTVRRITHRPWWQAMRWDGLAWGHATDVHAGNTICDSSGRFRVVFTAMPDRTIPPESDPSFTFDMEASVTDVSGETQQGSTSLRLAHRAFGIELDVKEAVDRSDAAIGLRAVGLDGRTVDVPLNVRIVKVAAPQRPLRARQWERPDRFVMTREEHAVRFPDDPFDRENEDLSWPEQQEVLRVMEWRGAKRDLSLTGADQWDVGAYRVVVEAQDERGGMLRVEKVFRLIDHEVQLSGAADKAFHVELLKGDVEPGARAVLLVNSGLPEGRVLMEIERGGRTAVSKWLGLKRAQQRVELPVLEEDRGGFFVHFLCVERGREHRQTVRIDVPWSNKDLQVEWMSFRDHLRPGEPEEWRLRIRGPKGSQVAAQVLALMYDASLDRFVEHEVGLSVWPEAQARLGWLNALPFQNAFGEGYGSKRSREAVERNWPALNVFDVDEDWLLPQDADDMYSMKKRRFRTVASPSFDALPASQLRFAHMAVERDEAGYVENEETTPSPAMPALRSDFRETAFFLPDLLTDRDGSVVLRFTTPDALTRWKLLGLAHTRELQFATFQREAVTQKPLMVVPHLPRFLRAGDRITLTAKINVLEEGRAEGMAGIELFDPFTGKAMDKAFGVRVKEQAFVAAKGESAVVAWTLTVPEGVETCGLRITARSKGGPSGTLAAADGEEHVLPVLTDRVLVTESVPLWSNGQGTRRFTLPNLLASGSSTTLKHQSLKLELTPDPVWYAVQALPYLMEFPHACAEQLFARYYANRIAKQVLDTRPAVRDMIAAWHTKGPDAFISALERNAALKDVLLTETPWVLDARDGKERRAQVALLFDLQRMHGEEQATLQRLREMQLDNGAWPWWSGMAGDRLITQHIVSGFAHLQAVNAGGWSEASGVEPMLRSAMRWLDAEVARAHERRMRERDAEAMRQFRPGYADIHYLLVRGRFNRMPLDSATHAAVAYLNSRVQAEWTNYGLQEQAMIAMVLYRIGEQATAATILRSLKERATVSEELGMYWKTSARGTGWNEFPVETHALLMLAFLEVTKDTEAVNALRTHLLTTKRTTDWGSTKATTEACHALLFTGDIKGSMVQPVVKVGGLVVKPNAQDAAGITLEHTWSAAEVRPTMGEVSVSASGGQPLWGALHWQYLEQADKVSAHASPLRIERRVLVNTRTTEGPVLLPLDKGRTLRPGDRITVRLELRTDRWLDHVHVKDLRAAGLEPMDALSGYRYQGGIGFYQSIRDAAMHFFIDRLAPGTHVFEYALRVAHAGDFSNGLARAQCMYAPEFGSHSEGSRLVVNEME